MTPTQEKAITLSLNILQVGFFECPKHYYQYFINNDAWSLLMAAGGRNDVDTPPPQTALAVLRNAVAREGCFADMPDFKPPAHHCSFLRDPGSPRRPQHRPQALRSGPTGLPLRYL